MFSAETDGQLVGYLTGRIQLLGKPTPKGAQIDDQDWKSASDIMKSIDGLELLEEEVRFPPCQSGVRRFPSRN